MKNRTMAMFLVILGLAIVSAILGLATAPHRLQSDRQEWLP